MRADQVARLRLQQLGLTARAEQSWQQLLRRLGVVQSQDYGPAGWSLGQRVPGLTQDDIDLAYGKGELLRTHLLRPTWHFVLPGELRRLLQVTGTRVSAAGQPRLRQLDLGPDLVDRGHRLIGGALAGGHRLTRKQLTDLLAAAGLPLDGSQLGHLLMQAELAGLVCSGGLVGKQHSYALVDERVPAAPELTDDEALAALTLQYFGSHGPATAKDFQWWASLPLTQVRRGLDLVGSQLQQGELDELGGVPCWWAAEAPRPAEPPPVLLLQGFDEYTVAYTQSKYVFDRAGLLPDLPGGRPVYNLVVVIDSKLGGAWKRTLTRDRVLTEVVLYAPLDRDHRLALDQQVQAHARFLGREPVLNTRIDPRLNGSLTRKLTG
jgi:hypothetical protein